MKDEHFIFLGKRYNALLVILIIVYDIFVIVNQSVIKIESPIANSIVWIVAIFLTILIGINYFEKWRMWWKYSKCLRKGGFEKVISDDLVPRLEQIFQRSGIEVDSLPLEFKEADEFKIPKVQLVCSIPDSDKVIVYFVRYTHCLNQLVVSMQPTVSKWWKLRPDMKTLNKIRIVLEENGATDLPPFIGK